MVSCRILCFALNCLFDFPRNVFCAVSILTRDRPVYDHSLLPFVIISNGTYIWWISGKPNKLSNLRSGYSYNVLYIWCEFLLLMSRHTQPYSDIFSFFQRQFCCYFIHLHAKGNIGNSNRSRKYYWITCRKFQECVDRNGEQMEQICFSNKATPIEVLTFFVWPCKWWTLWN